jgi:hypothetical protein
MFFSQTDSLEVKVIGALVAFVLASAFQAQMQR